MLSDYSQMQQPRPRNSSITKQITNDSAKTRTVYIEEQVQVLQKIVVEADPLLTEMCTILNDFEQVNKKLDLSKKQTHPIKD